MPATRRADKVSNRFGAEIDQFFSNKRNNRELFVIYDTRNRRWREVSLVSESKLSLPIFKSTSRLYFLFLCRSPSSRPRERENASRCVKMATIGAPRLALCPGLGCHNSIMLTRNALHKHSKSMAANKTNKKRLFGAVKIRQQ